MKRTPATSFETIDPPFEQIGKATFLAGMDHMLKLMQRHVDAFRANLEGDMLPSPEDEPPRRGRPRKAATGLLSFAGLKRGTPEFRAVDAHNKRQRTRSKQALGAQSGWADMTPEERSAEMKRRMAVRKLNRSRARLSQAARSRWAHKTRAQQKAQIAALQAGKLKAQQHVNGAA